MISVAALWRHPIKSHGREALESVTLTEGKTMPWDRHWAVTHQKTKFDANNPEWVSCRNFVIGVTTPGVAGIWAKLDEATQMLTLTHQDLGTLQFNPDEPDDVSRFLAWVSPLTNTGSFQPSGVVAAPDRGMTDSPYPSVSIMTHASHKAVQGRLGRPLEIERWRGNIWLDGAAPWEENEWLGKEVQIGEAVLHVHDPILRCAHTKASPKTGLRDTDTLGVLRDGWGHQNFGVYATVLQGGKIGLNDKVKVG